MDNMFLRQIVFLQRYAIFILILLTLLLTIDNVMFEYISKIN